MATRNYKRGDKVVARWLAGPFRTMVEGVITNCGNDRFGDQEYIEVEYRTLFLRRKKRGWVAVHNVTLVTECA